jgi:hypothetical protein
MLPSSGKSVIRTSSTLLKSDVCCLMSPYVVGFHLFTQFEYKALSGAKDGVHPMPDVAGLGVGCLR